MKKKLLALTMAIAMLMSVFGVSTISSAAISGVEISVYGNYETAGVNVKASGLVKDATNAGGTITGKGTIGTVRYRKTSESVWKDGHDLVKYDGNHMATSLFDLDIDTEYIVEAFLDGTSYGTKTFKTKKEFAVPSDAGRTIVNVSDASGLTTALTNATSNSTILLASGTYEGAFTISNKSNVVIKAASDNVKPIIKGRLTFDTCENMYLDGIEVTKSSTTKNDIVLLLKSKNVSVSNCYVHDAGTTPKDYTGNITIRSSASKTDTHTMLAEHTIINNIICDTGDEHIPDDGGSVGNTYFGIKIGEGDTKVNASYITIRDNYIFNLEDGIHSGSDEKRNPIFTEDDDDYLEIRNNTQEMDFYNNVMFNFGDDCIETDGHMVNGRFFKNRLGRSVNSITVAATYPGPIFFTYNYMSGFTQGCYKQNTNKTASMSACEVTRNCYFYNNTVIQTVAESRCLLRQSPGIVDRMTYMNNIFYAVNMVYTTDINPSEGEVKYTNQWFDYNLLFSKNNANPFASVPRPAGTSIYSPVSFETLKQYNVGDQNSINADPEFNMTDWYYELPEFIKARYPTASDIGMLRGDISSSSPAVDSGTIIKGITNNIVGSAPDIGAFEYGYVAPTPTVIVTPMPISTPTPTESVVSITPTPTTGGGVAPTPTPTGSIEVKKPSKVSGLKATSKKKKVAIVTWKKAKNTTGYEVYRSLKKNKGFKKVKTLNGSSKVKFTDKKTKSNIVYYYKVRAVNKVGSERVDGTYSAIKKVKVK